MFLLRDVLTARGSQNQPLRTTFVHFLASVLVSRRHRVVDQRCNARPEIVVQKVKSVSTQPPRSYQPNQQPTW